MNIIKSISNFTNRGKTSPYPKPNFQKKKKPQDTPQDAYSKSAESEPGFGFLDGMSTGTARFIIDREVDPNMFQMKSL